MNSKNIKYLVLLCVKVGGSDVYSEVSTATTCFIKKQPGPGDNQVNTAVRKFSVVMVFRRAVRLLLVKCYDIRMFKLLGCSSIGVPSCS